MKLGRARTSIPNATPATTSARVGGAVVGGAAGHYMRQHFDKDDLEAIGEALIPDSSAMLLLLEDTESEDVVNDMSDYRANVVSLTVGDELSGQIAQYTAAVVTNGNSNGSPSSKSDSKSDDSSS